MSDPSVMPACARPGLGAITSASHGIRFRCVCEGVCGCEILVGGIRTAALVCLLLVSQQTLFHRDQTRLGVCKQQCSPSRASGAMRRMSSRRLAPAAARAEPGIAGASAEGRVDARLAEAVGVVRLVCVIKFKPC